MILRAIHNAFKKAKERGWNKTFWAIDIHDTIVEGNYKTNDIPTQFYPFAKETLQLLTQRDDVKLILFTCSHPHEIEQYIKLFEENEIHFDYINENPEVQTDLDSYGNYDKKFYFNVLMDDKAGFNPMLEWEPIYWQLIPQENEPYIKKVNQQIQVTHKYNPNFGDDKECVCGHPYHRHFDAFEEMYPIGCKYCSCRTFEEITDENREEIRNKNLMIPRFEIINTFPDSLYKVGEIIEVEDFSDEYDDYPHIYKRLPWYANRTEDQMPKYVKFVWDNTLKDVVKIHSWLHGYTYSEEVNKQGPINGFTHLSHISSDIFPRVSLNGWLPATEKEYLSFIKENQYEN